MSRLVLDTSAFSHFRRGDSRVAALVDSAEWIGMPAIVLGELRAGFSQGRMARQNEEALRAFLSHPVVEILAVDDEVSGIYADIFAALRRAGSSIPTNDIWIAATAARAGATILTFDEHFRLIARVGAWILERA